MPIDPSQFWGDWPASDDAVNRLPDLTQAAVSRAEAYFGVTLPMSFVDLLKLRNGGSTRGFVIPVQHTSKWVGDHLEVGHLCGIGDRQPLAPDFDNWEGAYNIYQSPYMIREWALPERQITLCGDGHTWITLDFRHSPQPTVTWFDNDAGPGLHCAIIASSFDDFLAKLLPSDAVDPETMRLWSRS